MGLFPKKILEKMVLCIAIFTTTGITPSISQLQAKEDVSPKKVKTHKRPSTKKAKKEKATKPTGNKEERTLKVAIDRLATLTKGKDTVLKKALKVARNTRHAIKAKKATQKHIDKAIMALNKAAGRNVASSPANLNAIRDVQLQLGCAGGKCPSNSTHKSCDDCREVTVITDLPYTITKSGYYCLSRSVNLSFEPTGSAITVQASNVDIDLANHVITLSPTITGISASNVTNLAVHDGTILTTAQSTDINSNAIFLSNVTHADFNDLILINTNDGAKLSNSIDVLFCDCKFSGHANAAIELVSGTTFRDVTIEDCEFRQMANHTIFVQAEGQNLSIHNSSFAEAGVGAIEIVPTSGSVANVEICDCDFTAMPLSASGIVLGQVSGSSGVFNTEIRDCRFIDAGRPAISFRNGRGLLIEDCELHATTYASGELINLSAADPTATVADVLITNCILSGFVGQATNEVVFIGSAQGVLIDKCVIDANVDNNQIISLTAAGVHIAATNGIASSSDIKLRNCVVRSSGPYGIFCDGLQFSAIAPDAIEIDSCLIEGAGFAGVVFNNTQASTIKNSEITRTGVGIFLQNNAHFITVQNNTVVKNSAQGISIDATSTQNNVLDNTVSDNGDDGILVAATNNSVQDNRVTRNTLNGINNTGGVGSVFFNNTSCNNAGTDCVNISPINNPNDFTTAGANVCCTPAL